MGHLRWLTAGESHGPALTVVVEGVPAGLPLTRDDLDVDLARRQRGYGRGGRMKIERDRVAIESGVRGGETLGSPITLRVENRDFANWQGRMGADPFEAPPEPFRVPRPGHADLAGALKYDRGDLRDVLERASARETAARVAAGGVAKVILAAIGVTLGSRVVSIADVDDPTEEDPRGVAPRRRAARGAGGLRAARARPGGRGADEGGHPRGLARRGHRRRRGGVRRPRAPAGPREPRPLGPQARRTSRAGGGVHPGDQGGGDRRRLGGGAAARIGGARRHRLRPRSEGGTRAPPTGPGVWRAASPRASPWWCGRR